MIWYVYVLAREGGREGEKSNVSEAKLWGRPTAKYSVKGILLLCQRSTYLEDGDNEIKTNGKSKHQRVI